MFQSHRKIPRRQPNVVDKTRIFNPPINDLIAGWKIRKSTTSSYNIWFREKKRGKHGPNKDKEIPSCCAQWKLPGVYVHFEPQNHAFCKGKIIHLPKAAIYVCSGNPNNIGSRWLTNDFPFFPFGGHFLRCNKKCGHVPKGCTREKKKTKKPLLPKDALAKIGPAPPLQGRGEVMKIEVISNMYIYIYVYIYIYIWMFPKIGIPKMDGENNGKPY